MVNKAKTIGRIALFHNKDEGVNKPKFKGYLEIYPEKSKELELPEVDKSEELDLIKITPEQHFTKPPARYSDAGLVKELEKHGIGRPSTYAPTIATIEARNASPDRAHNETFYAVVITGAAAEEVAGLVRVETDKCRPAVRRTIGARGGAR